MGTCVPGNGPVQCIRDEDFEEIRDSIRQERAHRSRVETKVDGIDTKMNRVLEGIEIGTIRPVLPSIDYEEGENTKVQSREQIVVRGKVAERDAAVQFARAETLEEQVAGLRAQLKERDRQSDRARAADELALKKWQVTAGVILGVLAAIAAIVQAIWPAIVSAFGG